MSWQYGGPPDNWDHNHPFAPWNQPEAEAEEVHRCEKCGDEVPDEHAEASRECAGSVWCDACLVANANECGDWDQVDIAAAERLGAPHPAEPTTEQQPHKNHTHTHG